MYMMRLLIVGVVAVMLNACIVSDSPLLEGAHKALPEKFELVIVKGFGGREGSRYRFAWDGQRYRFVSGGGKHEATPEWLRVRKDDQGDGMFLEISTGNPVHRYAYYRLEKLEKNRYECLTVKRRAYMAAWSEFESRVRRGLSINMAQEMMYESLASVETFGLGIKLDQPYQDVLLWVFSNALPREQQFFYSEGVIDIYPE